MLVWNSPWIPSLPSFIPSPIHLSHISHPSLTVKGLLLSDSLWNLPLLSSLFDNANVREILKIKRAPPSCSNFIWTPSSNGMFSSYSVYNLLYNSRANSVASPLEMNSWKRFWKLRLNDRLKLFLWKIAWDIVPSKSRLNFIFNIPSSDLLCPLCKLEEDSLSHLFFRYIFARVAWRVSFWPLNSLAWSQLSLASWIKGIINPSFSFGIPHKDAHLFQIFAAVLCDLLWWSRNEAVHDGIILDILVLTNSTKKTVLEHYNAWTSCSQPVNTKWAPPAVGSYKINFDSAIRESFSAQAAVCRDSNGYIIEAVSRINPPCDPNYGEALAAQFF